jgi:hypothetical protein
MITENQIVYWFILKIRWNFYFGKKEPTIGQFVKFQDKMFLLDDENLYFYSREEFNLENENVGSLRDKLKKYTLPIDKRLVQVLKSAKKIEDLRLLYDYNVIKEFQKKLKDVDSLKVPFQIMLGEIDLDEKLQLAEISENYEECRIIADTIHIQNILKRLFI